MYQFIILMLLVNNKIIIYVYRLITNKICINLTFYFVNLFDDIC